MLNGGVPTPWKYFDKGSMATIGRNAAVLLQWIWACLTYGKGSRIISGKIGKRGLLNDSGTSSG